MKKGIVYINHTPIIAGLHIHKEGSYLNTIIHYIGKRMFLQSTPAGFSTL